MSLLCSVCHIFTTYTRMFSQIQLLVNKKFFHQSSFKLIKTVFISPASIYATLFNKAGRSPGGKCPRLKFQCRPGIKMMMNVRRQCILLHKKVDNDYTCSCSNNYYDSD